VGFHHEPVLVREVTELMEPAGHGEILDGTVGGGGHSLALLERFPDCRILAVDRDPEALAAARTTLAAHGDRVRYLQARFDHAAESLVARGETISGALLDLGVSGHQLDLDSRGFTFRPGAPLDMRMGAGGSTADASSTREASNTGDAGGTGVTAAELLNESDESELLRLFREYGEEPQARRLARAVTLLRGDRPFRTAEDLVEAMAKAYRRPPLAKEKARIFQALRIEVNREMESIDRALPALRDALLPGGVLVVIAYHSLEDRRVKHAFRDWSSGCICPPGLPVCGCGVEPAGAVVTRQAVRPSEAEVEVNPRSRSARLRAWRKAA